MDKYVKQSCYEMLRERKYEFVEESKSRVYTIFKKGVKKCCIIFSTDDKLNINNIKEYIQLEKKINHLIIVYMNSITSAAKKSIRFYINKEIELFRKGDILPFKIINHSLVPKHELVSKSEIEQYIKNVKILPKLLKSDAIVRYYNFKKDDIIRITRKNGMIAYRLVVD